MNSLSKNSKRFILLGSMVGIFAIVFFVLYHFRIIKTLDIHLCVTYISYFVGLGFLYCAGHCKEKGFIKSKVLNYIFGLLFLALAIAMLVYGIITGYITLF